MSSFHYFISHIVVFTWIFHEQRSGNKFSSKKRKYGTVAFHKYYFIEEISRTTYHRNLIDPLLKSRKFPPYCGYNLQIMITTPSLITACFFAISVKNQPKIQPCDVTLDHVIKFQKE